MKNKNIPFNIVAGSFFLSTLFLTFARYLYYFFTSHLHYSSYFSYRDFLSFAVIVLFALLLIFNKKSFAVVPCVLLALLDISFFSEFTDKYYLTKGLTLVGLAVILALPPSVRKYADIIKSTWFIPATVFFAVASYDSMRLFEIFKDDALFHFCCIVFWDFLHAAALLFTGLWVFNISTMKKNGGIPALIEGPESVQVSASAQTPAQTSAPVQAPVTPQPSRSEDSNRNFGKHL